MPTERIIGLAATDGLFARLPDAARDEAGVELAIIARDILALQQVRTPKDTGALEAGLSLATSFDKLRVQIGLLGLRKSRSGKTNLADLFYGIIVDKGRAAQDVVVERRSRIGGALRTEPGSRGRRKRLSDIVSTYVLHVKARAAVPFVDLSDAEVDSIAAQRLNEFWDRVIDKAGAGS
jgi:hypothetical protein